MPWSAMPSGMHNMLSKYKYNDYTFKKEGNNDYKKVVETNDSYGAYYCYGNSHGCLRQREGRK